MRAEIPMLSKISPSQGNKGSRLVLMCGSWLIQRCIKSFECMYCENRSEAVYGNREERPSGRPCSESLTE